MKQQKKFENFDGRLRREAALKSALLGIAVGGGVALIASLVVWFLTFNGLILAIALFVAVSAISSVIFYRTVFYPSVIRNARRLDRYGLDERLITMVELENDDSFIAKKQREDALANLNKLDSKKIKFKIPRVVTVLTIVLCILFAGMATVEGLSISGIIPTGAEVWTMLFPPEPPEKFDVIYTVGTGGYIVGNKEQTVTEGTSAEKVLAVSDEGYMFYAWSDGKTNPSRTDVNVVKDLEVMAVFIEVPDAKNEDDDGDEPNDAPAEGGMPIPSPEGENGQGGKYVEINQVIDGETYYRDVYEEYYQKALAMLEEGKEIPEDIRAIIEAYYSIIK